MIVRRSTYREALDMLQDAEDRALYWHRRAEDAEANLVMVLSQTDALGVKTDDQFYTDSELEEMGQPLFCSCPNLSEEVSDRGDRYMVCHTCGASAPVTD